MKVNVKFAATIPVGDFTNIRPEIELVGIDTEQELAPQLDKCLAVVTEVWHTLDEKTEVLIMDTVSHVAGKPGVNARLETLESQAATRKNNEQTVVTQLKKITNALKEQGLLQEEKKDGGEDS